jgi:hypothetical protein
LPKLGATAGRGREAKAQTVFFTSGRLWYAIEFDGEDTFYGLIVSDTVEFGTFRLSELRAFRGVHGVGVQRNRSYKPTPVGVILDYYKLVKRM